MTQINLKIEESIKQGAEQTFEAIGISMSTAITIFLKKVAREHRIPFELTADPFYSQSNIDYLEKKFRQYNDNQLLFEEHSLIED